MMPRSRVSLLDVLDVLDVLDCWVGSMQKTLHELEDCRFSCRTAIPVRTMSEARVNLIGLLEPRRLDRPVKR
jgi:hypothetical protein